MLLNSTTVLVFFWVIFLISLWFVWREGGEGVGGNDVLMYVWIQKNILASINILADYLGDDDAETTTEIQLGRSVYYEAMELKRTNNSEIPM